MIDLNITLGHKRHMATLTEYLKTHGVTQAAFAARVDLTQGYIAKLCGGAATPTLVTAYKIEEATAGEVPAASWLKEERTQ